MFTETEAIIMKQTKIANGRRMLVLFTKKFGKISAGTSLTERGKGKAALALRPFALGRYELNKSGNSYHLNGGEVIESHYRIGEVIDKYVCASYVMEFTEKLLPDDAPSLSLYLLLEDFLDRIEKRTSKYETLVMAFQVKALKISGSEPQLKHCIDCGSNSNLTYFSIRDGGVLCESCVNLTDSKERLLYKAEFDILNILRYLTDQPLSGVDGLALEENTLNLLRRILRKYYAYHMDISGLKSEELMETR